MLPCIGETIRNRAANVENLQATRGPFRSRIDMIIASIVVADWIALRVINRFKWFTRGIQHRTTGIGLKQIAPNTVKSLCLAIFPVNLLNHLSAGRSFVVISLPAFIPLSHHPSLSLYPQHRHASTSGM